MTPYYEHAGITIYHGDCREILPSLPKCGLLLTDPPYGIKWDTDYTGFRSSANSVKRPSLENGGHRKKYAKIVGDDQEFDPTPWLQFPKSILWGANCYSNRLPMGSWLVWDKRADNGHSFLADAEVAWMSSGKGIYIFDHCWQGFSRASENGDHYHPTQKPIALMEWCLVRARQEGIVLDPFMGSGSTMVAAKNLGRKAIGIEIEEKYCEIAAKRLGQEVFEFLEAIQ